MGNSGTFRKGDGRPRKPKGAKNKVTQSIRQAFKDAFDEMGGVDALVEWGMKEENQGAFYALASKLIPTEITGPAGEPITFKVIRPSAEPKP